MQIEQPFKNEYPRAKPLQKSIVELSLMLPLSWILFRGYKFLEKSKKVENIGGLLYLFSGTVNLSSQQQMKPTDLVFVDTLPTSMDKDFQG